MQRKQGVVRRELDHKVESSLYVLRFRRDRRADADPFVLTVAARTCELASHRRDLVRWLVATFFVTQSHRLKSVVNRGKATRESTTPLNLGQR